MVDPFPSPPSPFCLLHVSLSHCSQMNGTIMFRLYINPALLSPALHSTNKFTNHTHTILQPGEAPAPEVSATSTSTSTSTQPTSSANDAGMGIVFYALVLLGGGLAFGAYKYLQAKSSGEAGK